MLDVKWHEGDLCRDMQRGIGQGLHLRNFIIFRGRIGDTYELEVMHILNSYHLQDRPGFSNFIPSHKLVNYRQFI